MGSLSCKQTSSRGMIISSPSDQSQLSSIKHISFKMFYTHFQIQIYLLVFVIVFQYYPTITFFQTEFRPISESLLLCSSIDSFYNMCSHIRFDYLFSANHHLIFHVINEPGQYSYKDLHTIVCKSIR